MELITQIIISGILSAALSGIAYKLQMLTFTGALASLVVGYTVGVLGSVEWLILLVAFTFAGLIATRMDLSEKSDLGLQEGNFGERTHKNVLGVGMPACIFAFLYWLQNIQFGGQYDLELTVAFITTLTVAAADTVASEIGIRDRKVWLITTFERVKRGTNGGVSALGTVSSVVAAAFTGTIGWLLIFKGIDAYFLIPIAMGIAGNLIDSVFGATFERKGMMSKYTNNCLSALIGAVLGILIVMLL
ncbi:MAG: DUF92 domain-containing protein [Candidatus Methanoplasma sp.]|jgi:uncharacterized protein (TIGR00297 family)|nr:DUF92 domain-containing protein [Candidatus Methanoplasma sp.]